MQFSGIDFATGKEVSNVTFDRSGRTPEGRSYKETHNIVRFLDPPPASVGVRLIDRKGFHQDRVVPYPAPPVIRFQTFSLVVFDRVEEGVPTASVESKTLTFSRKDYDRVANLLIYQEVA